MNLRRVAGTDPYSPSPKILVTHHVSMGDGNLAFEGFACLGGYGGEGFSRAGHFAGKGRRAQLEAIPKSRIIIHFFTRTASTTKILDCSG